MDEKSLQLALREVWVVSCWHPQHLVGPRVHSISIKWVAIRMYATYHLTHYHAPFPEPSRELIIVDLESLEEHFMFL
jgi:hypothetical protein